MFSPRAFLLIPLGYLYFWPLVQRISAPHSGGLQRALTTVALSVGGLAWALFWIGLIPGRALTGGAALLVVISGGAVGVALNHGVSGRGAPAALRQLGRRLARLDGQALMLWAMLGSAVISLIHSLYYPFIGDDTLSRHGLQARLIYQGRTLPPDVWGYPPVVPLTFAATWFAAGQANEHLAKLLNVVAATGLLGVTILLARRVLDRRWSLLAGVLLAVTPLYVQNASLDYADIPAAFPMLLALVYAFDWWHSGADRDAWLAGILLGIAVLTKQSALTAVPSLALVPPIWLLSTRYQRVSGRLRRAGRGLIGFLLPALALALPWYIRNGMIGGLRNIVPIAGEYHLLEPSVGVMGLLPPLAWPRDFGGGLALIYTGGWLIGFGLAARSGWALLRRPDGSFPGDLLLAAMAVPYWLAWWARFSFDPRFLVVILPILAIWAARPVAWVLDRLSRWTLLPRIAWRLGVGALLGLLVLWGARDRIGAVYYALSQPLLPEEQRIRQVKGGVYDLALYIRSNMDPQRDRIMVMDGRLAYYLTDFNITVRYPLNLADLEGFDYLVHSSSVAAIYNDRLSWQDSEFYRHIWDAQIFETVHEQQGVHIMRILRTTLPPRKTSIDLQPRIAEP